MFQSNLLIKGRFNVNRTKHYVQVASYITIFINLDSPQMNTINDLRLKDIHNNIYEYQTYSIAKFIGRDIQFSI